MEGGVGVAEDAGCYAGDEVEVLFGGGVEVGTGTVS